MAHIEAVLRRAELPPPEASAPDFAAGELTINFEARSVRLAGAPLKLTALEYKLPFHLVRNAGRLMPSRALIERISGADYGASDHQLQSLMYRLRSKIERPRYIESERELGIASAARRNRGPRSRRRRLLRPRPDAPGRVLVRPKRYGSSSAAAAARCIMELVPDLPS